MDFKTFRCSTPSSVSSQERKSSKPTFPFLATDWRWCWTPKRLEVHLPTFTTGFVLPSIKNCVLSASSSVVWRIVRSLRLSDHFALVVGCINNNWLNLWKKDACKVFTGISPPLSTFFNPFSFFTEDACRSSQDKKMCTKLQGVSQQLRRSPTRTSTDHGWHEASGHFYGTSSEESQLARNG